MSEVGTWLCLSKTIWKTYPWIKLFRKTKNHLLESPHKLELFWITEFITHYFCKGCSLALKAGDVAAAGSVIPAWESAAERRALQRENRGHLPALWGQIFPKHQLNHWVPFVPVNFTGDCDVPYRSTLGLVTASFGFFFFFFKYWYLMSWENIGIYYTYEAILKLPVFYRHKVYMTMDIYI